LVDSRRKNSSSKLGHVLLERLGRSDVLLRCWAVSSVSSVGRWSIRNEVLVSLRCLCPDVRISSNCLAAPEHSPSPELPADWPTLNLPATNTNTIKATALDNTSRTPQNNAYTPRGSNLHVLIELYDTKRYTRRCQRTHV
jgi:hypothetical protein